MSNYWASSPVPHEVAYPKWMFHDTEPPKQVLSKEEEMSLDPAEWSANYADHKRDYPKAKFQLKPPPYKEGETWYIVTTVDTPEDEGKLEGSWSDTVPAKPAPTMPAPAPAPL